MSSAPTAHVNDDGSVSRAARLLEYQSPWRPGNFRDKKDHRHLDKPDDAREADRQSSRLGVANCRRGAMSVQITEGHCPAQRVEGYEGT